MLDILKARKEALEERGNKGFTLAELLIVVAIIAVLVAISIPVFTTQLEKAREATDASNIRSQYAKVMAAIVSGEEVPTDTVALGQTRDGWQKEDIGTSLAELADSDDLLTVTVNISSDITASSPVKFTYTAGTGNTPATLVIGQ